MFDKLTIDELKMPEVLNALLDSVNRNTFEGNAAQVLPDGFSIKSIEQYLANRPRFIGTYKTNSLESFANYVNDRKTAAIRIFVNDEAMEAKAVFDFETMEKVAYHCEDIAIVKARIKAEYKALLEFVKEKRTQKECAEFMEDYADFIMCIDSEGDLIQLNKAVSAVRRIEVNANAKTASEVQSFSAEKSTFESMAVNEANKLPSVIRFTCVPYSEFSEFSFDMRLSVITGNDIKLAARIIRKEEIQENISENFCNLIGGMLNDLQVDAPIVLGVFTK